MDREQIIKALECCIETQCENCCNLGNWHEQWNCMTDIMRNALSLIKELTVELEAMRGAANSYKIHNEKLTEENERIVKLIETISKSVCNIATNMVTIHEYEIRKAIADIVQKMRTEIEKRCIKGGIYPAFVKSTIAQIAEEIIGTIDT